MSGASHRACVAVEKRPNGELLLTCPIAPLPMPPNMIEVLLHRARLHPDRTLIAEQDDRGHWQHLTYGQAVEGTRAVAQWLIDQGASVDRPLAILSPRSRQHFLMAWGAQMARVPYCPVSVPYSTVPGAFSKLRWVLERVRPAFVYAEDLTLHQTGLDSIDPASDLGQQLSGATFITGDGVDDSTAFVELDQTEASSAVDESIASIESSTITRYLFTSGSTGMPKGVTQTQAMHMAFLGAMKAIDAPETDTEVRVLDWMPWSHTGAGVMRVNAMIHDAGSIYLDTGRPVAGQFDPTITNLASVLPTTYGGSPLGWSMLVDALEDDDELASGFFKNVKSFGFGAAAMPAPLAERIQVLAVRHTGQPILLTTSLLSTEVSVGLNRWWPTTDHDVLGLPGPGTEIKLVPVGDDRYEVRVRGSGVTPGYLDNPEANDAAFDDERFFKMGDAVRFSDPMDPSKGLKFAGRVSEDFKLASGTWVQAGSIRSQVVAAASPYVRDAVICGLNEMDVTALIWPNNDRCRELSGAGDPSRSAAVKEAIAAGLARRNVDNPGSSTRIARFLLLEQPPDAGTHEITEKGYINQNAVQNNRSAEVSRLYAAEPDDQVVIVAAL